MHYSAGTKERLLLYRGTPAAAATRGPSVTGAFDAPVMVKHSNAALVHAAAMGRQRVPNSRPPPPLPLPLSTPPPVFSTDPHIASHPPPSPPHPAPLHSVPLYLHPRAHIFSRFRCMVRMILIAYERSVPAVGGEPAEDGPVHVVVGGAGNRENHDREYKYPLTILT